jgi:hypothetical protein
MNTGDRGRTRRPHADDAVDEIIRRRFRSCVTLPLFPDPPPLPDIGRQLRLLDRPSERTD